MTQAFSLLNASLQSTNDGILIVNRQGSIVTWNQKFLELWNLSDSNVSSRDDSAVISSILSQLTYPERFLSKVQELYANPEATSFDLIEFLDGRTFERYSQPQRLDNEVLGRVWSFRDITRRKNVEDSLKKMSRRLQAIHKCSQAILRQTDELELIREICTIICKVAGYRMAWVGYAEHDEAKSVRPVAWGGAEDGYLDTINISWADTPLGRGPAGQAIRNGTMFGIRDFRNDPAAAPWREEALKSGYRSSVALPLKDENGAMFGVLNIYSAHVNAFTPDEKRLIGELAEDLSFGVSAIRTRAKRIQAEEELKKARLNYETFFNTIDDFLFVLDENATILHVNDKVYERLGYRQEEIIGQSVLMVHPPERREEAARIVGEMLAGKAHSCPVPLITKTGSYIPVETRVNYGTWDGKPMIFGVTKDISQLTISEEKFSKVFRLNPSACGLNDMKTGEYLEVNDAFYSLLGFTKEEVIGKTALGLGILTPNAKESIIQRARELGKSLNIEADLTAKDGSVKHVLLSAENIVIQDQEVRFTIVHDITERRKTEEALKESEQLYHSMFERTHAIKMIIDPKDGRIVDANSSAEAFYGYGAGNLKKMKIWDINTLTSNQVNVEMKNALDEKKTYFTFRHRLATGEVRDVEVYSSPLKIGNRQLLHSIIHDVTARKQAESEIIHLNETLEKKVAERTAEYETANRELTAFSYSVAHDLRAPIRALDGFSKILLENYSKSLDPEGIRMLQVIADNSTHMGKLIDSLLDFSRVSREELSISMIDMREMASEVFQNCTTESERSHIRFILHDIPEVPGDPVLIRQVWTNLIGNAIKFSSGKADRLIEIGHTPGDGENVYFIRDNGAGFDMRYAHKLFGVFERLHSIKEYEGSGIGLALSQRIILRMNGRIWGEGAVGEGATFWFALPLISFSSLSASKAGSLPE